MVPGRLTGDSGLLQGSQQIALDVGERLPSARGTGHQNQFERFRQFGLVETERLAQIAFDSISHHRVANLAADNHPQPREKPAGAEMPVEGETSETETAAVRLESSKLS